MAHPIDPSEIPDFLVKSTFGATLVATLLVTPFAINDVVQGRYVLGVITLIVSGLCAISTWYCYHGHYPRAINLYGIAPGITVAIAYAVTELGVIGSYWPFLGALAFYIILPEKQAWKANIIFIAIIVPVAWNVLEQAVAIRFVAVLSGTSVFAFVFLHEITKQHYMLKERLEKEHQLNFELQSATGRVNQLHGLLPICANCKKIRDDDGYYQQIEHYITEHSDAEFTHGICPDCAEKLYPGINVSDA